ncbi:helix-turn-helix domain-containing protein [Saccharicrinis aurantiacus]|uniref:helix-turn-helix domain-containing protein n=1 Tax=Saccharicrinis aurantiacus TaxID=1849719 RepID=UPI000838BA65|nr:helix-turn-helix domain-containing protein [Saccharicrinis aurantiacus]
MGIIADTLNHIAVILIFGGLLLLAFIKLTNPQSINGRANRWFALFLILFSSFWLEEIFQFAGINEPNIFVMSLVHGIQGSTPFSFYLCVWHFTNIKFVFKKQQLIHLFLPCLFIALVFLRTYFLSDSVWLKFVLLSIILLQALYYSFASFVLLRKHQKNILEFASDNNDFNLKWLENIIIQVIIISVLIAVYSIVVNSEQLNLFANSFLLFTVYFIGYHSLKQKELFPISEKQKDDIEFIIEEDVSGNIEKRKLIADADLNVYKQKLNQLMLEDKVYLDNDLNLVKLADSLLVSPHQLSYIINEGFNENFFSFINKYRVDNAKQLLVDPSKDVNTMLSIAFDSGFNSKTAFNTTFKKLTGYTPSEFRKKERII